MLRIHRTFANGVRMSCLSPLKTPELCGYNPALTLRRGVDVLLASATETLTWWIAEGTALGFARDGGFIAWDTDVDVHIALDWSVDYLACLELIGFATIKAAGFKPAREMRYQGRLTQLAFIDTANDGLIFDLLFFYGGVIAGQFVHYSESGVQEMPAALVGSVCEQSFRHGRFNAPDPLEGYCAYRYGAEWRTPSRSRRNPCRKTIA